MSLRRFTPRLLRASAFIVVLGLGVPCIARAQAETAKADAAKADATSAVRQQLQALLPSVRIDDADLRRALDAPAWTVCRSLQVEWRASNARDAIDGNDGSLEFVAESRCREPYDVRPPARIGSSGLMALATDRDGGLLWWKPLRDIRRAHPSLMPSTGDEEADRRNRRLHSDGVRVGYSRFDIGIPGDRRMARLWVFEATRQPDAASPVLLGSVTLPAP